MTTMTVGLAAFCVVFAINSSVHSYLVVRYSEGNKVTSPAGHRAAGWRRVVRSKRRVAERPSD